ncbi:MAG: NAD nucleotidase [Acidimicrobiia bacterium]|nr:NAD nucleotidase [Acidimicrobiia bacterium]
MMKRSSSRNRSRRFGPKRSAILVLSMLAALVAVAQPAAAQDAVEVSCAGQVATIVATTPGPINGTAGDDVIVGTSGVDTINAGGGNDVVCGLGGADVILGGPGRDIILGANGPDQIWSGPGNDLVWGGAGNDMVYAGFGVDVVFGGPHADTIAGGPGNDRLNGGSGNDSLFGRNGSDVLSGGNGNDILGGGNGNDILRGNNGDDDLTGGNGRGDRLQGGGGTDVCRDRGFNTVFGGCESDFELTILHMNDHHSHLSPDSGDLDLAGVDTRVSQGGFPSAVAKIDELSAANDGNVVKIHAGDAVTGTLFYSLFKGEADAALMNEVCFDIFELGNHEFDDGDQGLADFLGDLSDTETCETAVLGANVVPQAGTPLAPPAGNLFEPFKVIEYDGDRVGYIGIDIAGKTMNSSSPLETTMFLDEVETAQQYVDELTADGVDKIVLVTHIQLANDINLASMVSGVDVIVGGDSHTLLGNFAPLGLNTSGRYPYRTADADGSPVCIVQAWQYSWIVGELNVNFDEDGVVTSCDGTPHLLLEDTFQRRPEEGADREELAGAERQAVLDFIAATPELSVVTPDADAQTILDGYSGQVETLQQQVIGSAAVDLCLERIPGQGRSQICDVGDTAQMGGDIQQVVTDAFRVRAFESDFALQNAGGVRVDIPAGDLTIADAYELLPFANTIVNLEMTGAEINAVLEEAIAFALDPDGSTGAYPYASGLRWDADMNAAEGSRISNLQMRPSGTTDWVALDMDATFTVATNSFIAAGRDGYVTFGTVSDDGRVVDTFLDYAQSFIDYIEQDAGGVLNKPPAGDYSTQNFVPLAAA